MNNPDEDTIAKGGTLFDAKTSNREKRTKNRSLGNYEPKKYKDIEYIEKITDLVKNTGLLIHNYKRSYVIRRIKSRLLSNKFDSYKNYYQLLKKDDKELETLITRLSINVTRFFRNKEAWNFLSENIITKIKQNKKEKGRKILKIWSAGCAVGAETYTMAIILNKLKLNYLDINIIGTDFNESLLEIARSGRYSDEYVAEMDKMDIIRFFNSLPNSVFEVKKEIKETVRFRNLDITSAKYPKNLDLIICRNLLIYLHREAQETIFENFIDSLKPNGYLFLGKTETLSSKWRSHFNTISTTHRIYQKKLVIDE